MEIELVEYINMLENILQVTSHIDETAGPSIEKSPVRAFSTNKAKNAGFSWTNRHSRNKNWSKVRKEKELLENTVKKGIIYEI